MSVVFEFYSVADYLDLQTFLKNSEFSGCESVKFEVVQSFLLVSVGVFEPINLFDSMPVVLGMRVWRIKPVSGDGSVTVLIRTFFDRRAMVDKPVAEYELQLDSVGPNVSVPDFSVKTVWAGISPPKVGWFCLGDVGVEVFENNFLDTIKEFGILVEQNSGSTDFPALAADKLHKSLWRNSFSLGDSFSVEPVLGVCFTAKSLGFFDGHLGNVSVYSTNNWLRFSFRNGYVLQKMSFK